jgi:hypothetical protein
MIRELLWAHVASQDCPHLDARLEIGFGLNDRPFTLTGKAPDPPAPAERMVRPTSSAELGEEHTKRQGEAQNPQECH